MYKIFLIRQSVNLDGVIMIREYQGKSPVIDTSAYIDVSSVIIGDVIIGADSSVWPCVVIRGDVNAIKIGVRTNVQDGTVIHVAHDGPYSPGGYPALIGNDVTIGHQATIHACTILDRVLVGMGARILDGAHIESDVVIGAASLVPPKKVLQSGYLYLGSPVRRVRKLTQKELQHLSYSANHYVKLATKHKAEKN
jgi:carbonic anhydrase/acetyltransferase-like protein (isoleucine patch superfamily)